MDTEKNDIIIKYKIKLSDNEKKDFTIRLNGTTLDLIQPEKKSYPEWTNLDCNQCPHCPLSTADNKYCPIAKNLVDTIAAFKDSITSDKVVAIVETKERAYVKETYLQSVISSLIGIYMVTSGCPVMDNLRPMVRYHLPFTSSEEIIYRALSMYLVGQFIRKKSGYDPDWELKRLYTIYEGVNQLNTHFILRLKEMDTSDSVIYAVTTLDCFAQIINLSFDNIAEDLKYIYKKYL